MVLRRWEYCKIIWFYQLDWVDNVNWPPYKKTSLFGGANSLRRRANARNVSSRISLRWPIHIINPASWWNQIILLCCWFRYISAFKKSDDKSLSVLASLQLLYMSAALLFSFFPFRSGFFFYQLVISINSNARSRPAISTSISTYNRRSGPLTTRYAHNNFLLESRPLHPTVNVVKSRQIFRSVRSGFDQ